MQPWHLPTRCTETPAHKATSSPNSGSHGASPDLSDLRRGPRPGMGEGPARKVFGVPSSGLFLVHLVQLQ